MPHTPDATRTLHLTASPNPAFVDQPIHLLLTGALPNERVRLTAWLIDDAGRRWESRAEFTADATGTVDPTRDAPLQSASPYRALDPMGLFWSMQLNPDDAGAHDQYLKRELTPTEITIEASAPSLRHIARLRIERHHVPPSATIRAVDGDHQGQTLAGLLFIPARETPDPSSEDPAALAPAPDAPASPRPRNYKRPAIITLGGSGGGLDWETAAALCAHGYAALALPYFGFDPLPSSLNSIPLEYFERAIAWLCRQPEIDPGRLAIHGISRGGELALLLATKIPLIRAVVGVVPGNVIWQATGNPPPETAADLISNFNSANAANAVPLAPADLPGSTDQPINTNATGLPPAAAPANPANPPTHSEPATQTATDSSAAASPAGASLTQPDSSNPSAHQKSRTKPSVPIKRTPGNTERSSWTYQGSHLPFIPYAMARFRILTAIGVISFRRPVRFVNLHRDSLRQKDAAIAAEIPVENASAAILLISASDDQVWPSEAMSDSIIQRLTDHHYSHEFTHLKNPGAGHLLRLPHTPATTASSKLPNFGLRVAFGGSPADTAAARLRAWLATLSFLSRNLT